MKEEAPRLALRKSLKVIRKWPIGVAYFWKLTADEVLIFDCIANSCLVNLLKTGYDCLKDG